MKKLLLLLIIPFLNFGQGWEQDFGGAGEDIGRSVQQTTDGGYIITGHTQLGEGGMSVFLIKTDMYGDSIWSKTFDELGLDSGYSVQQTSDGGYIITGSTVSLVNPNSEIYLIKTNGNGDEEWSQTFGGSAEEIGSSVQQTTDGGYIITGWTESFGNGSFDIYLIKTDSNGVEQWTKTFGGTDGDYGRSVQQTSDGGYIITGFTYVNNLTTDLYLVKTDGSGNEQWSQVFGNRIYGESVQQTTDGGYIIAGFTKDYGNGEDFYLLKTDMYGDSIWSKTFGGVWLDDARSVQQTTDGGYIICGYSDSFSFLNDVYLVKTDGSGNEQWSQTFGGIEEDEGFSVQQTADGGYIVCGFTDSFNTNSVGRQLYLIKIDGSGNISLTFETPTINKTLIKTIDILGRETTTKKDFQLHVYDDGSVEKKYVIK